MNREMERTSNVKLPVVADFMKIHELAQSSPKFVFPYKGKGKVVTVLNYYAMKTYGGVEE
jgi:hypothetical protein